MMSASEGGGGSWKSGRSKGGSVNFILQISSKCGQGWEGVKNPENFADVINESSLWGHPDMMSASDGGGGHEKVDILREVA